MSLLICLYLFAASNFLEYEGAVRLVGDNYTSSGLLEVFLNDQWGTVCNSRFSFLFNAADTVCKQLGYTRARAMSARYRNMTSVC